jgi:CDP-glycerol glycerophosphotransferase (TagB/SpsB family)
MKTIFYKLKNISLGFLTMILNLFFRRDKRIILFGAWMGSKFADNPRFLYQYIWNNKDKYDIKKAVWVTRNRSVYNDMKEMGYCVFMMNSVKSYYYHIKSGIHIICNIHSSGVYNGDIIGELSHGAIKIQLWHGVAIKASGHATNEFKKLSKLNSWNYRLKTHLYSNYWISHFITYAGGWDNPYYLVTSDENARVMKNCFNIKDDKFIMSSYPRWYSNNEFTRGETIIIDELKESRTKYKAIVLYLPTFRDGKDGYNKYIHPLKVEGIEDYIEQNNILWIEKAHNASTLGKINYDLYNYKQLDVDFDVDLVYDFVDLVITDYSSVSSDAIFKGIQTLYFVPDYDDFLTKDRGFVNDFDRYCPGYIVKSKDTLLYNLDMALKDTSFSNDQFNRYEETKKLLFGCKHRDMDDVALEIIKFK